MIKIVELIRNTELLEQCTIAELQGLLERYPYYQTLRLLLLGKILKNRPTDFEKTLGHNAALILNRRVLFLWAEGSKYQIPEPASKLALNKNKVNPAAETGSDDRTLTLIDSFLRSAPKEDSALSPIDGQEVVAPSVDYVGYLMQSEAKTNSQNKAYSASVDKSARESFVLQSAQTKIKSQQSDFAEEQDFSEQDTPQEEFFTETLAKIYIKQQKYERAMEIIRALSAHNPKKISYFADQIRFLEKLVKLNNK